MMDTFEEILRIRDRKKRLSDLYDNGRLPFHSIRDPDHPCQSCGRRSRWIDPESWIDTQGEQHHISGSYESLDFIDVDERDICRACFVREYYIYPANNRTTCGSEHPATPWSERSYHGGRWNKGEW